METKQLLLDTAQYLEDHPDEWMQGGYFYGVSASTFVKSPQKYKHNCCCAAGAMFKVCVFDPKYEDIAKKFRELRSCHPASVLVLSLIGNDSCLNDLIRYNDYEGRTVTDVIKWLRNKAETR